MLSLYHNAMAVDDVEFQRALRVVFRCHAKPWVIDEVFQSIIVGNGDTIGYDEMVSVLA